MKTSLLILLFFRIISCFAQNNLQKNQDIDWSEIRSVVLYYDTIHINKDFPDLLKYLPILPCLEKKIEDDSLKNSLKGFIQTKKSIWGDIADDSVFSNNIYLIPIKFIFKNNKEIFVKFDLLGTEFKFYNDDKYILFSNDSQTSNHYFLKKFLEWREALEIKINRQINPIKWSEMVKFEVFDMNLDSKMYDINNEDIKNKPSLEVNVDMVRIYLQQAEVYLFGANIWFSRKLARVTFKNGKQYFLIIEGGTGGIFYLIYDLKKKPFCFTLNNYNREFRDLIIQAIVNIRKNK